MYDCDQLPKTHFTQTVGFVFRESNQFMIFPSSGVTPRHVSQNHTKKCTTCMGALEKVNQGLKLTKTSAVVSLSWVSPAPRLVMCDLTLPCNARFMVTKPVLVLIPVLPWYVFFTRLVQHSLRSTTFVHNDVHTEHFYDVCFRRSPQSVPYITRVGCEVQSSDIYPQYLTWYISAHRGDGMSWSLLSSLSTLSGILYHTWLAFLFWDTALSFEVIDERIGEETRKAAAASATAGYC